MLPFIQVLFQIYNQNKLLYVWVKKNMTFKIKTNGLRNFKNNNWRISK